ncbi:MAG: hypothetical protein GVY35_16095, partial [Bacteroidetes bacterium]|nr:hypothetical protein [Bacteroidota bacterium]
MANEKSRISRVLSALLTGENWRAESERQPNPPAGDGAGDDFGLPTFSTTDRVPEKVDLQTVEHPDGRMSQYPPRDKWDDWVEWDG